MKIASQWILFCFITANLVFVTACDGDESDPGNSDSDADSDADSDTDADSDSDGDLTLDSVIQVHCEKLKECWPSFYDSYGGDDGCNQGFRDTFWSSCDQFNPVVGDHCVTITQKLDCSTYVNLQLNDPELPSACEYICGVEEVANGGTLLSQDIVDAHCEREADCFGTDYYESNGGYSACSDGLNEFLFGSCDQFNSTIADHCLQAIQSETCTDFLNHQLDDPDRMKECWYICGYDTMPPDL